MYGRSAEVGLIDEALGGAGGGTPQVVLVTGEPGIGKTRLSAEAAERAASGGAPVLYGRCQEEAAVPYQPFAEALGGWVEELGSSAAETRLGATAEILAPLLPGSRARAGEANAGAGDGERYLLFGAVARALSSVAGDRAVLLVLDDLHWADEPTLEMLRHVVDAPARLPVAVVVNYRSTELLRDDHPLLPTAASLRGRDTTTTIALSGLSEREVAAVVADLSPGLPSGEMGALVAWLRSQTGGNPFLTRQLVRHLAERGELEAAAAGERELATLLPGSVRDVTLRRVRRLGPEAFALLSAAAVAGDRFDTRVARAAAGVAPDDAAHVIHSARRAGLVEQESAETRSGFAHALVARALRDALPAARRGALHRRVAEAMEALAPEEPPPAAEIAHHLARAEPADAARTRAWAERAAAEALAALAPQEAIRWLSLALELHGGPPQDPSRLDLVIALGDAQRASGDPGFRETLLEASRLAQRAGGAERLARAALHNTRGYTSAGGQVDEERVALVEAALEALGPAVPTDRARLLALLASERTFDGDWRGRKRTTDEAIALAREAGDPQTLCYVLHMRQTPIWVPDTLPERLAESREAVGLAEGVGDLFTQSRALIWHAMALIEAGEIAQAHAAVSRATALADELGQPYARWQATIMVGNLAAIRGELEEAERWANAALEIGMASGQPDVVPFYANQIASIRYDQGRLGELQPLVAQAVAGNPGVSSFRPQLALALCEAGLPDEAAAVLASDASADFAGFDYDLLWLGGMAIYAEVAARVDDADAAARLHERLSSWSELVVNVGGTAWDTVQRALGRLAATLGRLDEAQARLASAVERCEGMGARVWHARAQLDLARVLAARQAPGDSERAGELLERALAEAQELGARTVEREARVLIGRRLAPAPPSAPRAQARTRRGVLRREGQTWRLEIDGRATHVPDSRGTAQLARLLRAPGTELPAAELEAGSGATSDRERARVNVTRALRRAIARIGEHEPALADQLDRAVRTGAVCVYDPLPGDQIAWTVEES